MMYRLKRPSFSSILIWSPLAEDVGVSMGWWCEIGKEGDNKKK
jgi:hypothetical protein